MPISLGEGVDAITKIHCIAKTSTFYLLGNSVNISQFIKTIFGIDLEDFDVVFIKLSTIP